MSLFGDEADNDIHFPRLKFVTLADSTLVVVLGAVWLSERGAQSQIEPCSGSRFAHGCAYHIVEDVSVSSDSVSRSVES